MSTSQQYAARIQTLHARVADVCPIAGVSVGRWEDKLTWRIDFALIATQAQRTQALDVLGNFDPTVQVRSELATVLDTAMSAIPSIDPRIKAVFIEWRKQIL